MVDSLCEVFKFGVSLSEVEESTYYGDPCLKRNGKVMCVAKEGGETLSLRLNWEDHDRLLCDFPDVFYKTEHLDGWPWIYARIRDLELKEMKEVLQISWESAPLKIKNRHKGLQVP